MGEQHLARNCRQRSNKELCGPTGHAELGRQGTTLDSSDPGSATEAACGVQMKYWIRSGNERQGPMRNQLCPRRGGNRL